MSHSPTTATIPNGTAARPDHDVFLSYHGDDRTVVLGFKGALADRGISSFLDRHDLTPGLPWPEGLERALGRARAVLVFVGRGVEGEPLGPWQRREVWFALDRQAAEQQAGRSFPVIPVLLPGARVETGFLFLNTWIDLRDGVDDRSASEAVLRAIRGEKTPTVAPRLSDICPYRALNLFREEDAPFYFGREAFSQALLDRISGLPLVALIGASGSGKSSVVQAGLLPLLRRQRPPNPAWDSLLMRPGDRPFQRLSATLVPLLEPQLGEVEQLAEARRLAGHLGDASVMLADVVDRILVKSSGTDRLLLVIDQFEELFTLTPDKARAGFVSMLLAAVNESPLVIVLTLRSDFYGQAIDLDRSLSNLLQDGLVNLGPMTRDELHRAIESPAARLGVAFEPGLTDRILDHVAGEPGALPLLEFALTRLWEKRTGATISHAEYEAIGEVYGAVSARADNLLGSLPKSEQEAALDLMTRLVRVSAPGGRGADTRQRVELDSLTGPELAVAKPFVDARLLVLDRGEEGGQRTIEIAHEALIGAWPKLRERVDRQRDFLLWRQRLTLNMQQWIENHRSRSALLRGPMLREARQRVRQFRNQLSPDERDFLARSSRRWRHSRILRYGGLGVLLLAVIAVAGLKLWSSSNGASVMAAAILHGPLSWERASPSRRTGWLHAMDTAGRVAQIGDTLLNIPGSVPRLEVLMYGALFFHEQGRQEETRRLAERALALSTEVVDFRTSVAPVGRMAMVMHAAERHEQARQFAEQALSLAEAVDDTYGRAQLMAGLALTLGHLGLDELCERAITAALTAADSVEQDPRFGVYVRGAVAPALALLDRLPEALESTRDSSTIGFRSVLTQALVDRDRLSAAMDFALGTEDAYSLAIASSALLADGRMEAARETGWAAFEQLARIPIPPGLRGRLQALLLERVLLRIFAAQELLDLVTGLGQPGALTALATTLARRGETETALTAAGALRDLALPLPDGPQRYQLMGAYARVLAISGRPAEANGIATTLPVHTNRASALAAVALGYLEKGDTSAAASTLAEADKLLDHMDDMEARSNAAGMLAQVRVRLGDYELALSDRDIMSDDDFLAVVTLVITDSAVRPNPGLKAAFAALPFEGMGRYGFHWP